METEMDIWHWKQKLTIDIGDKWTLETEINNGLWRQKWTMKTEMDI